MFKTDHFIRRAAERGIDDLAVSILHLYGERLDGRDGLILRRETTKELRRLAVNALKGRSS